MIRSILNLGLLFLIAGCATSLTQRGQTVKMAKKYVGPDCKYLGGAYAYDDNAIMSETSSTNRLINYTADKGGNWLMITRISSRPWFSKMVEGNMYYCPSNSPIVTEKCSAGDAAACEEVIDIGMKNYNLRDSYAAAQVGCRNSSRKSCDFINAQEKKETELKVNCEDKRDGDACGYYAIQRGLRGYDSDGKYYFNLGCEYKSKKSCAFKDFSKQYDEKVARERAEESAKNMQIQKALRDEAVQNQQRDLAVFGLLYNTVSHFDLNNSNSAQKQNTQSNCIITSKELKGFYRTDVQYDLNCK